MIATKNEREKLLERVVDAAFNARCACQYLDDTIYLETEKVVSNDEVYTHGFLEHVESELEDIETRLSNLGYAFHTLVDGPD